MKPTLIIAALGAFLSLVLKNAGVKEALPIGAERPKDEPQQLSKTFDYAAIKETAVDRSGVNPVDPLAWYGLFLLQNGADHADLARRHSARLGLGHDWNLAPPASPAEF